MIHFLKTLDIQTTADDKNRNNTYNFSTEKYKYIATDSTKVRGNND